MSAEHLLQPIARSLVDANGLPSQQERGTLVGDRTPHGLCLWCLRSQSGDEVWYAVCDRHEWLSIGGARAEAERAICDGCTAVAVALQRQHRFVREYGRFALAAMFDAIRKRVRA